MTEHTHEYDCIVCGEHFDSQDDLVSHNEKAHLANATGMERPRTDRPVEDESSIRPNIGHDRNPRQGFLDPDKDKSQAT